MSRRCALIVSMTASGVIGLHGTIPWHYSSDMKRFKRRTLNSTIIMGRNTWESLPRKPLPERQNIVISSRQGLACERYASINQALANAQHENVWFIGGVQIYDEAIKYCDLLDVTYVPDEVNHPDAVYFPEIDWGIWATVSKQVVDAEHGVYVREYVRVEESEPQQ